MLTTVPTHSNNEIHENHFKETINERYEVLDGTEIDIYHFYGSWFEHTWDLTLKDSEGKVSKRQLDTRSGYVSLSGETIEFDGEFFHVIK